MLDIFGRYILLCFNDVTWILIKPFLNKTNSINLIYGANFDFISKNQLIPDYLLLSLSYFLSPVFINNTLIVLNIILSSFLFFVLLRQVNIPKRIVTLFLLFFPFSLYSVSRYLTGDYHLYFVFVFPLVLLLLFKKTKPWVLGIAISLIFYTSNYYGYFSLIVVFLYYLYFLKFKDILVVVLVSFAIVALPNIPSFIRSTTIFGKYSKLEIENSSASKVVPYRPIEDFFSFSFRPWYFVIPPTDSIFFGEFSKNIYAKLKNTGYFLAQNYDPQEAGGSFMGWTFLGFGIYGIYLLLKKDAILLKYQRELRALLFCLVIILLITGPPYWSLFGIKIYTPSYLLYLAFPVFRVLVRFAPVIFLILLVFSAFGFKKIEELYLKKPVSKAVFYILILATTVLQFAIKIPIVDIKKPPEYVVYLSQKSTPNVAIYPNTYWEASFWFPLNNIRLANLRGIVVKEQNFNSDVFTKNLPTYEGLKEASNLPTNYLLFIKEKDLTKEEAFFRENLYLEKDFGEVLLFRLDKED